MTTNCYQKYKKMLQKEQRERNQHLPKEEKDKRLKKTRERHRRSYYLTHKK